MKIFNIILFAVVVCLAVRLCSHTPFSAPRYSEDRFRADLLYRAISDHVGSNGKGLRAGAENAEVVSNCLSIAWFHAILTQQSAWVDSQGALLDQWGQPFRLIIGSTNITIWSSGRDGVFSTGEKRDDTRIERCLPRTTRDSSQKATNEAAIDEVGGDRP